MEISNLPNVTNSQVLQGLHNVLEQAGAAQNIIGTFAEKYDGYCKWSMDAVRILSTLISQDDVAKLVTTSRHWSLVERSVVPGNENVGVLYLLNTELGQRIQEIDKAMQAVQKTVDRWQNHTGRLIVPDTNIFLHEELQFDEAERLEKLSIARMVDIHLVIPIRVIRELDSKKRLNRGNPVSSTNSMELRTRARMTLRKLDELLPSPNTHHILRVGEKLGSGSVSLSLLLDDLSHVGLFDADSEILDRALNLQQATGREVTILTRDTAMSFSARNSGLKCILLSNQGD